MKSLDLYVNEERAEEIDQKIEEGGWNSRSDYLRNIVRAGESNFADLDPRTGINDEIDNQRVSDNQLINEVSNEFRDIDEIIDDLVEDFRSDLTHRLFEMAQSEENPVVSNGRGEYKIDK